MKYKSTTTIHTTTITTTTTTTTTTSLSCKQKLIHKFYGEYARAGGDGKDICQIRAQNLGYDELFLYTQCGLPTTPTPHHHHNNDDGDDEQESEPAYTDLFSVSCGSGCPLRLKPSNTTTANNATTIVPNGAIVLDLGAGAGHDVVLASRLVGPDGHVVGVDLSPDMIRLAMTNVARYAGDAASCGDVSFVCAAFDEDGGDVAWTAIRDTLRVGHPYATGCGDGDVEVDVVISNGVINLCENKKEAFQLAYRCLTNGGHFLLSDACKIESIKNEEVDISCKIGSDSWVN
mmetsp:Transcript_17875/g.21374  ORF Transcript_17875/g.21374 Transcript_17875/m.21374 type:complete len:289 (+) Transcript_17875:93-959(+)